MHLKFDLYLLYLYSSAMASYELQFTQKIKREKPKIVVWHNSKPHINFSFNYTKGKI